MNTLIEQCNNSLELIRNAKGFWLEILQSQKPYLIDKIATEFNRYNRHPHTEEMMTRKEEHMTLLSEYQRSATEQKALKEKKELDVKRQQYNKLQASITPLPKVVNMREAYLKVLESDITLNRDYERLTSNRLVV